MTTLALAVLMVAGSPEHFVVTAAFAAPARAGATAAVTVTFSPRDPDVRINEEPGPRLKLDPGQKVLLDKQAPPSGRAVPVDPDKAKYLDPKRPVAFPVAWAPGAPKGTHDVAGSVTYFYCSKREGWCRKGTSEIEVSVTVP